MTRKQFVMQKVLHNNNNNNNNNNNLNRILVLISLVHVHFGPNATLLTIIVLLKCEIWNLKIKIVTCFGHTQPS
jgi:hypothetical protein